MSRAHFFRKATDDQGNVVPGTTVTVYEPGTLATLADTLYVNEIGSVERDNPFVVNDGIVDFYLDGARQVKIGLRSPSGIERFADNQDVYPDPQTVVQAPSGLEITNIPQPGQFLQSIGSRQATWVNAPELVSTTLSPVETLLDKNFSIQNVLPLTLRLASGTTPTPTFVNVTADPKPEGFSFTHALDWNSGQVMTASTSSMLFAEPGTALFVYKVLAPVAGYTPATLRVSMDDGAWWAQTAVDLDEYDVWRVGYLANIPIGSHILHVRHMPGSDPLARVLLGALQITYGGAVPAHAHEGGGLLSTAVGSGASANFIGASALGAEAVVGGASGTAVGSRSSAQAGGTAIGANTTAVERGVAVGYLARTSPPALDAVAVGYNANAQGFGAVAVGPAAIAADDNAIALGKDSFAVQDSVAVGRDAVANGVDSIAIGAEATADHARSVALGPGAQTTATDQVVLGTAEHTAVVPGNLRQSGDAVLGSTGSTLGFYGEAGTTRPVVSGSRGGNTVLGALIAHLANLGLIDDQTTA